jgi:hypothetical protein
MSALNNIWGSTWNPSNIKMGYLQPRSCNKGLYLPKIQSTAYKNIGVNSRNNQGCTSYFKKNIPLILNYKKFTKIEPHLHGNFAESHWKSFHRTIAEKSSKLPKKRSHDCSSIPTHVNLDAVIWLGLESM